MNYGNLLPLIACVFADVVVFAHNVVTSGHESKFSEDKPSPIWALYSHKILSEPIKEVDLTIVACYHYYTLLSIKSTMNSYATDPDTVLIEFSVADSNVLI